MQILNTKTTNSKEVIKKTIEVLNRGGLIIFPTETTYGAGVDATNQKAVNKLLKYKSRREGKPLSIAVANKQQAQKYIKINKQAENIINQFLPGPVTVVSYSNNNLAKGVISEFNTLGIRIPDHPLILQLLQEYQKPITATSANASGKKRPYNITDILNNLSSKQKGLINLVLNQGELPHNDPSTVIDTTLSTPITLRSRESNKEKQNQLISTTEQETKDIAGKLLLKHWNEVHQTGVIFALDGALGTGKTIFTKGIATFLNINETIKSPTYSYIEEYDFTRYQTKGKLFHLDMWKIETKAVYQKLAIESLLKPNNIIVIEWYNQVASYINTQKLPVIQVSITETKHHQRKLNINEN